MAAEAMRLSTHTPRFKGYDYDKPANNHPNLDRSKMEEDVHVDQVWIHGTCNISVISRHLTSDT